MKHGRCYMAVSKDYLARSDRDPEPLLEDLKQMVRDHANSHPRSRQVQLGPSQVGHPCARNVISGLLAHPEHRCNPNFDPLPSYVGVASHKQIEEAAHYANKLLGRERWIAERKVVVREGLSGTCDLYDKDTATVIDHKFPGATKMTEYRKKLANDEAPSPLYRVQAHLYGRGYLNMGYPVERVAIYLLPRSGLLATSKLWHESYSEEIVNDTISKMDSMIVLMDELQLEANPRNLQYIPTTPYECSWCPYFTVNPLILQDNPFSCPGGEEYRPIDRKIKK
jgi:hypothetical protein